jgi:AcrR family transcriptional regulator
MDSVPSRRAGKPGRRSHAERSLATRLELIAATIRVIEERGLDGASTFEIAKAAGVTPGAIQHHFESKKALILSAATELVHADDRHGSLFKWPSRDKPLEERAREAVSTLWKLLYSRTSYVTMWSIFMACRTDPDVLHHLRAERKKLRDRAMQNFLATFPEMDAHSDREAFAELVFSSFRGMGVVQLFEPAEGVNERQLTVLSALIVERCARGRSCPAP